MFKISERTKELIHEIEKDGDNEITEKNVMAWIEDSIDRLSKENVLEVADYLMRNGNDLESLLKVYSHIDYKISL